MNFGIQFRVRGDSFGGHFINGISMAESESMWKCKKIIDDDDKTVYESSDGYKITAYHIKKTDVYECYTVFENNSDSIAILVLPLNVGSICFYDANGNVVEYLRHPL